MPEKAFCCTFPLVKDLFSFKIPWLHWELVLRGEVAVLA